jgi:steroid delta-isomerase-like uncharacterized protein
MLPPQQLIDAAKAPVLAFNDKNWDAVKASVAPNFIYEEVASQRRVQGVDEAIAIWKGWATAFPDARATIHRALLSNESVVLELTWEGTHQGPLQTPQGAVPPTGRRIDVQACVVMDMRGDKAVLQRHYFDMATLLHQLSGTPA